MRAITESVEIARSQEDVFAYLAVPARHAEWQDQLQSVRVQTDGPTHVGTRALESRRIGRRTMTSTYEITEHDPPRSFAFRDRRPGAAGRARQGRGSRRGTLARHRRARPRGPRHREAARPARPPPGGEAGAEGPAAAEGEARERRRLSAPEQAVSVAACQPSPPSSPSSPASRAPSKPRSWGGSGSGS